MLMRAVMILAWLITVNVAPVLAADPVEPLATNWSKQCANANRLTPACSKECYKPHPEPDPTKLCNVYCADQELIFSGCIVGFDCPGAQCSF